MCGGSPLIQMLVVLRGVGFSCRGEYTGEESKYSTLVLPSLNRFLFVLFMNWFVVQDVGEITQGSGDVDTLVLPSLNRFLVLISFRSYSRCRGDYTGEWISILSFSPLWNRNRVVLMGPHFMHFWGLPFIRACWWGDKYHRGGWPPILYIYSLRHFLTTKGALIDGDGYPPKNPKNDPKKVTKTVKNHSNLVSKNGQKSCFLMVKSSFSLKSHIID